MFVIVELLYGTQGRRKRKEKENKNIIIRHNICEGREYKDTY
jgi:hypothetical protein